MARPELPILDIDPAVRGWDGPVAENFSQIKDFYENKPSPHCLVYKTTPMTGAVNISTLPAADFFSCTVYVTDAPSVATNGHLAYSDGASWKYVKSEATV